MANKMPLQFKNSEGQVFLGYLGGINYCLFLYCEINMYTEAKILEYSTLCGYIITVYALLFNTH